MTHHRYRRACALAFAFAAAAPAASAQTPTPAAAARRASPAAARPLDIYVADTEGGKAALYISPSGETVLIDTGNPGERDLERILEMLKAAGVSRIDYLISTHYHVDHIGGLQALAARIPIAHFMDHGPNSESPEQLAGFRPAYEALYAKAKHTVLKPGDRVPVAGLDWRIVTSAGRAITAPLAGAGRANPGCAAAERRPERASPDDNAHSVGSVITHGRFRALDLGDLLWNKELDLVCPRNMIGTVDLYMVTHHGVPTSGAPALVHAVRPRAAVMQNGTRKGGAAVAFQTLRASPGLEDIWTLHWSHAGGIEHNSAGAFIANLDDSATLAGVLTAATAAAAPLGNPAHTPAHWIRISALPDGSFTITNSRNAFTKRYVKR